MSKEVKWVWLAQKCGQGSSDPLALIEKFGNIESIYEGSFEEYESAGVSERLAESLCDKSLDEAFNICIRCGRGKIGILCYDNEKFPASLRSLKNPPVVLYYVGRLPDFNKRLCVSIVGTRKMSEYGMKAAYKIAYEIAASGAVVVSGMALGIDGIASCAAIAARGCTVAVLGCGANLVYPKEHVQLARIIKQHGAIISEFPPSTPPRGMNFPIRNRIISGLSQATAVIDADMVSGAMITAKNAILQGRDVYAVPGNIDCDSNSGTNSLIRDGAQAILCGADIVKNYAFMYRDSIDMTRLSLAEKHSDFDPIMVGNMQISMRLQPKPKNEGEKVPAPEAVMHKAPEPPARLKPEPEKKPAPQKNVPIVNEDEIETPEIIKKAVGDNSPKVLEGLSEKQRRIFDEMPLDKAITVDYFTKTGFTMGEVISALTVLEIKGLISSLPGALYIRK